tara:strand:+ start:19442 stop:20647 length:1206 start_codon:yes stop_codon:yes gene_type:complete
VNIAHFDCHAGASGNMVLGALLDAGLNKEHLLTELRKLDLPPWEMVDERTTRGPLSARFVDFKIEGQTGHHFYRGIDKTIASADLRTNVRTASRELFRRLAEAEAAVHGTTVNEVEFHEVGAADAVLDIVGAMVAIDLLSIDSVTVSPINTGSGTVMTAHGRLPIPAPATARLLAESDAISYGSKTEFELLTPTGAAVLTQLASEYGPHPHMRVHSIGYGAGSADLPIPNVLRVVMGHSESNPNSDTAIVIEANIDDMNPEIYPYVAERLFRAAALDVWTTPIVMKEGRPATQLSILCQPDNTDELTKIVLSETTTLGLRTQKVDRTILKREIIAVETQFGMINVKVSYLDDSVRDVAPEASDCKRLAIQHAVAWREVYDAARSAGFSLAPTTSPSIGTSS